MVHSKNAFAMHFFQKRKCLVLATGQVFTQPYNVSCGIHNVIRGYIFLNPCKITSLNSMSRCLVGLSIAQVLQKRAINNKKRCL